jgi:ABC-type spermidine/putrescine transport system permease subunit II
MSRLRRVAPIDSALGTWTMLVFAFLFAPIVTVALYSFNEGVLGKQAASFTGFTTRWYQVAWDNGELRHSLAVSLQVAFATAVIATLLGTIGGIVLARHRGRVARGSLELLVYLLLIVPEIVLGVGFLLFYSDLGVSLGTWPLVVSHTPFTIAVVALVVRARAVAIDQATEEAAADLGAGRWRTFRDVTLPQLQTAILAGAVLAFTFSFDDLVISVFLTTPDVTTLPVYLFGSARFGVTPDVYAIAAVMLAFTLLMLAVAGLIFSWQARRTGAGGRFADLLAGRREVRAAADFERSTYA